MGLFGERPVKQINTKKKTSDYVNELRLEEFKSVLSEMSTLDLMSDKEEIMERIHSNKNDPIDRERAREFRSAIDRELEKRIDERKRENGEHPDQIKEKVISEARTKRKASMEAHAQKKIDTLQREYDAETNISRRAVLQDPSQLQVKQVATEIYGENYTKLLNET